MTFNPFEALGLPTRPDLDDEQVHTAWRAIAAATHPDRPDGGDPAWYAQASAAYAQLNSSVGPQRGVRRHDRRPARRHHPPARLRSPARPPPGPPTGRCGCSPSRIIHGRPLRLLIRAAATALLALAVLALIPGQPAAPADVAGLIWFFALTARSDLAAPPRR